ncbi:MAG: AI-2E family transporter [Pseudomonadota bacterium]
MAAEQTGAQPLSGATRLPDDTDHNTDSVPTVDFTRADQRSFSLAGLFVLAVLFTLYFAASLFIPLVLALLLSILFAPLVSRMALSGLPEPLGAAIVVAALLVMCLGGIYLLSGPASEWLQRLPNNIGKLEAQIQSMKQPIQEITKAQESIEQATDLAGNQPVEVVVERPGITERFLSGTPQVLATIGIVILLLYFLLASGDSFLRKVVSMTPVLEDKKRAVEIVRSIQSDISFYLATLTALNVGMGVVMALVTAAIGLPDPLLWGSLVTILSFAPYAGSAVITAVLLVAGLITFADPTLSFAPAAIYLVLMVAVSNVFVPFVLGRRLTLSPIAIFVAIIFWGWLWGVVGALVAVPLIASFKIVCDRVDTLKPVGEFLTP